MTDREKLGLRGPVRICETERDYVYPDRRWLMHTTASYSPLGYLLEERHRNPDGSQWSLVCRYDERGRILERAEPGLAGPRLLTYRYDTLDRLDSVLARSPEGERLCESYRYDAVGRKTATVFPDPALRDKVHVALESAFETSTDAASIVTVFDKRDRPVERAFYELNGFVGHRILMRYDAAGKLIEQGESEGDGVIREDLRHLYRYDSDGRLVEKTMHHYGLWMLHQAFAYNEHGDIIEERQRQTGGHCGEEPDQSWRTEFSYRYDEGGNWVERITHVVLQTSERRLQLVERRRIEYY
jgi:hypothetical protein